MFKLLTDLFKMCGETATSDNVEETGKVEGKEKEEGIHAGIIMFTLITEMFNMCGMCWKIEEMEEVEETKMERGKKEDNMENNDTDQNDCQHDWLRMMD